MNRPDKIISAARRKKIEALIRDAKETAERYRLQHLLNTANLLDDLADVAEKYLKGLK